MEEGIRTLEGWETHLRHLLFNKHFNETLSLGGVRVTLQKEEVLHLNSSFVLCDSG